MNHFLRGVVRALTETFELPGPIVEIGAYQVAGQEGVADLRSFFRDREYVGCDARSGPGVDRVADVESLPFASGSVGTVLALSTFEHVRRFWKGFAEVQRVLKPGGAFLVACPFFFRVHNYPSDYWRFTPSAMEMLLEEYPAKILGWHGPRNRPANVWALAFKEGRGPIADAEFARYREMLTRYAHEPAGSLTRTLRYYLARLLCGRGPFASYLDRNRWETVCSNSAVQRYRLATYEVGAPLPSI